VDKLKLLILYGGISEEHTVSVKSARELSRNLDTAKYDPIYVFIGRDGLWQLTSSPEEKPEGGVIVAPSTDRNIKGLVVMKDGGYDMLRVDVAFPMLHGRYGEDGTVQGILKMTGIPYVGCGIAASALCIDKTLTYLAAAQAGVRVPRHKVLFRNDEITAGDLTYPIFVKPARSGSSFGVSKVCEPALLPSAVSAAMAYDDKVLLEEAIMGLEIGCAVLGNGANLITGALDQIELSGGFFRIHQEASPEQGSENAAICVPAPIPEAARAFVVESAKTVYRALGCRGLARVDQFLTKDGQVVLNEVNSMPGFTSYSRYPRMMASAGIPLRDIIDRLIAMALENGGNAE
jgi:D-alanine--(R)-lactate ligase